MARKYPERFGDHRINGIRPSHMPTLRRGQSSDRLMDDRRSDSDRRDTSRESNDRRSLNDRRESTLVWSDGVEATIKLMTSRQAAEIQFRRRSDWPVAMALVKQGLGEAELFADGSFSFQKTGQPTEEQVDQIRQELLGISGGQREFLSSIGEVGEGVFDELDRRHQDTPVETNRRDTERRSVPRDIRKQIEALLELGEGELLIGRPGADAKRREDSLILAVLKRHRKVDVLSDNDTGYYIFETIATVSDDEMLTIVEEVERELLKLRGRIRRNIRPMA